MNKLIVDALDLLMSTEQNLEEVVDTLMREADIRGPEAAALREETLATLRAWRVRTVDRAGSVVDRITSGILQRLQTPTREEIQSLSATVQELRLEVARLRERLDGGARGTGPA